MYNKIVATSADHCLNVTSLCAIVLSCLLEVNNPVDNIEHNKEDWETLQEELVNSVNRKSNYDSFLN